MLKTMGLSDTLSAFEYDGRAACRSRRRLSLQMDGDRRSEHFLKGWKIPPPAHAGSLLDLAGRVFGRFDPTQPRFCAAIALRRDDLADRRTDSGGVAPLRTQLTPNYASILLGGACAIALGAMTSGVTPISGIIAWRVG